FDRLFSPSTNALLYQFLRGQAFAWGGRDTNDAVHGHSIRWTLGIDRGAAKLGFFSEVIDLVNGAVSEPVNLLDIYANFNLYGEVHYAHADAARGVTALYCANLEWERDWQGETFFYDGDEPAHVVAPRPGRLVLFDAALSHRGSPPARDCWEPRLYVVFKFEPGNARRGRAQHRRRVRSAPPLSRVVRKVEARPARRSRWP